MSGRTRRGPGCGLTGGAHARPRARAAFAGDPAPSCRSAGVRLRGGPGPGFGAAPCTPARLGPAGPARRGTRLGE